MANSLEQLREICPPSKTEPRALPEISSIYPHRAYKSLGGRLVPIIITEDGREVPADEWGWEGT